MKVRRKKLLLILIAITFASLSYTLVRSGHLTGRRAKGKMSSLNYTQITTASLKFVLSPLAADLEHNDRLMSLVVGSLLRMDRDGNLKPYLAESYRVTADGRSWIFSIRDGLTAEDGSRITAQGYVDSFNRLARLYLKNMGSIPYFDELEGFETFFADRINISGIKAAGNEVTFTFVHPPENYLIIYAVPAFGYYSSKNLEKDSWIENQAFISTGPMKVTEFNETQATLVARDDWALYKSDHVQTIRLNLSTSIPEFEGQRAVVRVEKESPAIVNGYRSVPGIPQWLVALVLNPQSLQIPQEVRKAIVQIWLNWHKLNPLILENSRSSPNFNFLDNYNFEPPLEPSTTAKLNKKFSIGLSFNLHAEEFRFIEGLFAQIKNNTGVHFELKNLVNPKFEDLYADKLAEGRITRVVVGANGHNANNQIMFSTKLGVCLPDPSGRIQQLIASYSASGKSIDSTYLNRFAKYLFEDGAVLPMFHRSNMYLVSDSLSPTDIPSDIDNTPLDGFSH